jgi:flavorubredoxin
MRASDRYQAAKTIKQIEKEHGLVWKGTLQEFVRHMQDVLRHLPVKETVQ